MEIFPCGAGGRLPFKKGNGLLGLDRKLNLGVALGPNLVCGDTASDVPMVEAALSLMSQRAAGLAVLFVVTPAQRDRTPGLGGRVRSLCSTAGAHCAVLPSPDVLIAALTRFTREAAGETVR